MKKTLLSLAALLSFSLATTLSAQNTSGTVNYEERIKLEIKLDGPQGDQFKDLLPKERINKMLLSFTPQSSLYKAPKLEKPEEKTMEPSEGATIKMVMNQPDNRVFRDLSAGKTIEQREFMDRNFLIEGDAKTDWKMGDQQRQVLGYNCQMATRTDGEKRITAWFAPSIPVSSGPASYGGLPGLILAVDVNDGQTTIEAKEVKFADVSASSLERPSKGKKVTRDEFKKIVDEKMKEMGAEGGGSGGNVIIKMRTH